MLDGMLKTELDGDVEHNAVQGEQSSIQERVVEMQRRFRELEERDRRRRIENVEFGHPGLTEEEYQQAIDMCNGDDLHALDSLTGPNSSQILEAVRLAIPPKPRPDSGLTTRTVRRATTWVASRQAGQQTGERHFKSKLSGLLPVERRSLKLSTANPFSSSCVSAPLSAFLPPRKKRGRPRKKPCPDAESKENSESHDYKRVDSWSTGDESSSCSESDANVKIESGDPLDDLQGDDRQPIQPTPSNAPLSEGHLSPPNALHGLGVTFPFKLPTIPVTLISLGRIAHLEQAEWWADPSKSLYYHPFPLGLHTERFAWGRLFDSHILSNPKSGNPIFRVVDRDSGDYRDGATATEAWTLWCKDAAGREGTRASGPLYFGFSDPILQLLIRRTLFLESKSEVCGSPS
ncbi:hypothetical protein M427DRAFT_335540 [Gonapodya prolifera JEL478]|uniref:Uncharacterized protein n=1 Tax=Gonapodya prolifera (strain JEL478) TaxID=1344416 RepID=A0A139ADI1_GONPJ|nr:hypothetical protein M427DRAFT_335540 [Gonapodya prolifera JEL478]|eukprot:KXS14872.1 hypothetical protein M427DRAFT_335540 [Gonapodya prolifera JEL478]